MPIFVRLRLILLLQEKSVEKEIVDGTDIQIYRELISGIYFGEKFTDENGEYVYDICKYNKDEIVQIAHLAFQDAQKEEKKKKIDFDR